MTCIVDIMYTEPTAASTLIRAHIICDTAADLPAVSAYSGYTLLMGSVADDISTGAMYIMQSDGTWVRQPTQGGLDTYTKQQIDTMLAYLQPYDIPQTLTSGSDVDTVTAYGAYQYSSADAATISGLPQSASGSGRLDVYGMPDGQYHQMLRTDTEQLFVRWSQGSMAPTEQIVTPAMTSDTTPSGTVIYSGQYQTRYGYYAFDGINSQIWSSSAWGDGSHTLDGDPDSCYIGYLFDTPQDISKVELAAYSDRSYTAIIQLQVGGVWQTEVSGITIPGTGYSIQTLTLQQPVTCTGMRLCITGGSEEYFTTGTYGGDICELYVYGMVQSFTWGSWRQISLI